MLKKWTPFYEFSDFNEVLKFSKTLQEVKIRGVNNIDVGWRTSAKMRLLFGGGIIIGLLILGKSSQKVFVRVRLVIFKGVSNSYCDDK